MPGVGMKCLNTIQPIFGVDMHKTIPPPLPVPPFAPHVVVWGEGWSQKSTFMWAVANTKAASPESGITTPVQLCWGYAIGRGHDAGPHPGHIWPNILLPLILLGAGSKSEFASGAIVAGLTSASSAAGRGLSGAFKSAFFGNGGLFAAFGRGFGRGFLAGVKDSLKIPFVSKLAPRALAAAFNEAGNTPVTRALLSNFPYIMGPVGSALGIRVIGSPLGYSSPDSVYGSAVAPSNQPSPNDWANKLGHDAAGEPPESGSPYSSGSQ